ncbi:MAG: hypothetical protein H3C34_03345 [Caldilineaceae bacterium]|nr:hypothetical protein [Caldilineaceae bacterium]
MNSSPIPRMLRTLFLILTVAAVVSIESADPVSALPERQWNPGFYVPRRVPIRTLPGGRIMRVISVTRGGLGLGLCGVELSEGSPYWLRPYELPADGPPPSAYYLPDSGAAKEFVNVPIVCTATAIDPRQAYALAPDGVQRLPAVVTDEARQGIITLPVAAYRQPGRWQLGIDAPDGTTFEITVPEPVGPTLYVGGDSMLLGGYAPNEPIHGIVLADRCPLPDRKIAVEANPDEYQVRVPDETEQATCDEVRSMETFWTYEGDLELAADEDGYLLIERVPSNQALAYLFFNATGDNMLASVADDILLDDAIAEGNFELDRDSLFVDKVAKEPGTGSGGAEPTPGVMPDTGASPTTLPLAGPLAALAVLALIAAAGLAALGTARRKQP